MEVPLRDYAESLVRDLDRRVDVRLNASEKLAEVTENAMQSRVGHIENRIRDLENAKANFDGRMIVVVGLIGIVVIFATHFWK